MATIKGVKRRLGAAARALNGTCTTNDKKSLKKTMSGENKTNAIKRALNGDYAMVNNKAVVRLEDYEVTSGNVFVTKDEAKMAATVVANKAVEEARQRELAKIRKMTIKDDSVKTVDCMNKDRCCGCGACYSVCPVKAISMERNSEGFLEPVIDYDKCTQCGLCKNICPSINTEYRNSYAPVCYYGYADTDVSMKSSSGGMFTLIAEYILADGGVVCGAGYTDDMKVEHFVIDKVEDLDKIRKSKYVQSDASKVYEQIKEVLKAGRSALFCGCGCQVAGLYAALKNVDTSKLYTADLLCHGGPSPMIFEKYLKECSEKQGSEIEDVMFRNKEVFGWVAGMTQKYKDGTVKYSSKLLDNYFKGFEKSLSTRKFCGQCSFAKVPRQGDITLGDFWKVNAYKGNTGGPHGTSVISVNNDKGAQLWDAVKDRMAYKDTVPYEIVAKKDDHQPYNRCHSSHPNRDLYFEMISDGASLDKATDYALKGKYDVGIVGVWYGANYGSVATYYALHQIIRSFGLSVLMIDKPVSAKNKKNDWELNDNHARRFAREHYHTSRVYTLGEMHELNNIVDSFVLGSDQVWNRGVNRGSDFAFYFNFVNDSKKKIAFGTSFGHGKDFCDTRETVRAAAYMARFDGIGIRETSGVKICQDKFGVDAVRVLDPVFVAERSVFDELADQAKEKKQEKYLLAYILDPTPEKRDAVVHLAEKLGLEIAVMLDGRSENINRDREIMGMDDKLVGNGDIGVEDWLGIIRGADFVVTDSCHGMSFSIVFERNFIGIGNKSRGVTRFESLVDVFQVRDHYVAPDDVTTIIDNEELIKPVDYEKVNEILYSERARSVEWLRDKLFSPKVLDNYTAYPVIDKRLVDDKED